MSSKIKPSSTAAFNALNASLKELRGLGARAKTAEAKRIKSHQALLSTAERDPGKWHIRIVQAGKEIVSAPAELQGIKILRALSSSTGSRIRPGEGAGCPEKTGCTNIGQFGDTCLYLCKRKAFDL